MEINVIHLSIYGLPCSLKSWIIGLKIMMTPPPKKKEEKKKIMTVKKTSSFPGKVVLPPNNFITKIWILFHSLSLYWCLWSGHKELYLAGKALSISCYVASKPSQSPRTEPYSILDYCHVEAFKWIRVISTWKIASAFSLENQTASESCFFFRCLLTTSITQNLFFFPFEAFQMDARGFFKLSFENQTTQEQLLFYVAFKPPLSQRNWILSILFT